MAAPLTDLRPLVRRSNGQLGLVTSDQLDGLGIRRYSRRTLEARGALERIGVQVWRLPGHPPSHEQRLLAAVLEAGPGAVVSHMAACAWWRFAGVQPGAAEVSVGRPTRRGRRSVHGRVHEVRDLAEV